MSRGYAIEVFSVLAKPNWRLYLEKGKDSSTSELMTHSEYVLNGVKLVMLMLKSRP